MQRELGQMRLLSIGNRATATLMKLPTIRPMTKTKVIQNAIIIGVLLASPERERLEETLRLAGGFFSSSRSRSRLAVGYFIFRFKVMLNWPTPPLKSVGRSIFCSGTKILPFASLSPGTFSLQATFSVPSLKNS